MFKRSFTLLEILFVIVALSIIASIAIPIFQDSMKHSEFTKIKSDVLFIRSNIQQEKNKRSLKNNSIKYDENLDLIFNKLHLLKSWNKINDNKYNIIFKDGEIVEFIYNNKSGTFDCLHKIQMYCENVTR